MRLLSTRWISLCFFLFFAPWAPAQSLGVYHWAGRINSLARATAEIERFGFDTVRIFAGGRYDYRHPQHSPQRFAELKKPVTLAKILALPRYRQLLENARIKTIWLTAYPVFDYGHGPEEIDLRRIVPEEEWRQESAQMREMAEWLYGNLGATDKVILISNHEADEKLREVLNHTGRMDLALGNVVRDLEIRLKAVEAARGKFPAARLKVFFGVEVSLWKLKLDIPSGHGFSRAEGINALEAVLPQLRFDFVSFSAWEVLARPGAGEALHAALEDIGSRTRPGLTSAGRGYFRDRHVLVGEFGYAREWKLPEKAGLEAVSKALADGSTRYAVYWQLYDNIEGRVKQFGLLDSTGRYTCAGIALLAKLRKDAVPPKEKVACRQ